MNQDTGIPLWCFGDSVIKTETSSVSWLLLWAACAMPDWQWAVASLVLGVLPPCSFLPYTVQCLQTPHAFLDPQWAVLIRHSWGSNNDLSEHYQGMRGPMGPHEDLSTLKFPKQVRPPYSTQWGRTLKARRQKLQWRTQPGISRHISPQWIRQ
mgnify:FL=1